MVLSRTFVVLMGLVITFLLMVYATEEVRCIARAQRFIRDWLPAIPAAAVTDGQIAAGHGPPSFLAASGRGPLTCTVQMLPGTDEPERPLPGDLSNLATS